MKKTVKDFQEKKYTKVKNALSKEICDLIYQYTIFDEDQDLSLEVGPTPQIHNSHSKYADPMMEALLLKMQPIMEENTGLKLIPTYSYYRVYQPGANLIKHKDRPACEISITLCLGYNYNGKDLDYPIYIDGTAVSQDPGDAVIYRGHEVEHWREIFEAPEGTKHSQVFLHYVDAEGPFAESHKFDGRPYIGHFEEGFKDKQQLPKYIIMTN